VTDDCIATRAAAVALLSLAAQNGCRAFSAVVINTSARLQALDPLTTAY
jgi:hypothetical protein